MFRKAFLRRARMAAWSATFLAAFVGALEWLSGNWLVGVNLSESLPGSIFLVRKGTEPGALRRGSAVAFKLRAGLAARFGYPEGLLWAKRVAGVPGDCVRVDSGGTVFVGGRAVSRAKARSSGGVALRGVADGTVVPPGFLFVAGDHEDSLDSRYESFGAIPYGFVVGEVVWPVAAGRADEAASSPPPGCRPRSRAWR